MRVEEIVALSRSEATRLEEENAKKLAEMEKNMQKASGTADWLGNITSAVGTGATIGAGVGMIADASTGGMSLGAGTLGGALLGATAGL